MASRRPPPAQVYVRSFADGNGDGVGDLPGTTGRLPHLRDLGWGSPVRPAAPKAPRKATLDTVLTKPV